MLILLQQAVKSSKSLKLKQLSMNNKDSSYYLINHISVQISKIIYKAQFISWRSDMKKELKIINK